MKRGDILARILAVITSLALVFVLAFGFEGRRDIPFPSFVIYIAAYSAAGVLFGFVWPNSGWRLGLYLFAVWPLFIVVLFLFSDPPSVIHWKEEILGLLGLLSILPGACLGAWIGSLLRRRLSGDGSHHKEGTLSTS